MISYDLLRPRAVIATARFTSTGSANHRVATSTFPVQLELRWWVMLYLSLLLDVVLWLVQLQAKCRRSDSSSKLSC